ncbi:hypothetical protein [Xanthomonas arboricola]|uniref:hypothetical protein n=1 Tax=Xanthomonas arboricola TaxID=56448 RepID=UPI0011B0DEF0|nr:hypothetical protein [Xanthomonas arboricola]
MGRKSEERARRQALKDESFEAAKAISIAKVLGNKMPSHDLSFAEKDQIPLIAPGASKTFVLAPKTGSIHDQQVQWNYSVADKVDKWSWGESRQWSDAEWRDTIEPGFQEFCRHSWKEITSQMANGHRRHHDHEVSDLTKEAQERWRFLKLETHDTVFRFRLGGQLNRAWGYVLESKFFLVWYERNHNIYITNKELKPKEQQMRNKQRKKIKNEKKAKN